jgi:hypothetical protein
VASVAQVPLAATNRSRSSRLGGRCHSFRVASFAVTPEQGREALAAGCQLLVLGFDVMFVPAAVQLYLAT